jgi:hypothetical protein
MQKHPVLRRHLSETRPFKSNVLSPMMKRYRTLFIKPDTGSHGKGIARLKHQTVWMPSNKKSARPGHILNYRFWRGLSDFFPVR